MRCCVCRLLQWLEPLQTSILWWPPFLQLARANPYAGHSLLARSALSGARYCNYLIYRTACDCYRNLRFGREGCCRLNFRCRLSLACDQGAIIRGGAINKVDTALSAVGRLQATVALPKMSRRSTLRELKSNRFSVHPIPLMFETQRFHSSLGLGLGSIFFARSGAPKVFFVFGAPCI